MAIGLTPLVEAHSAEEVTRAMDAGAQVIGINSRDLRTLKVDPGIFARLAPLVLSSVRRIAESGARGSRDVARHTADGADAVLVGEALVTGGTPRAAIRSLVDAR